jgi:predicted negative regulator of RcsB-dependent stress response
MTKTTKIILGVVLAVLVTLVVLLGVGSWIAYNWINDQAGEAIAQGAALKKEVDDFSAALPEAERQKFQACWQETNTPEFREKGAVAGQKRAIEECAENDAENILSCSMNAGGQAAFELLREHFESCKQQL